LISLVDFNKSERPKDNIMIVDALNLAFRWKHSGKLKFVEEYVNTVLSLAKSYSSGTVIIAADQGSSSFRKDIYPEYKQNRQDLRDAQTAAEAEEFKAFFDEYERTLAVLKHKFLVLRYKGVEADDIAALLVRNREKYKFDNIWLISSDKDWDLLVADNVSRFSYVTRKETTLETWDHPVPTHLYVSYKCLVGDTGDNIPGIPGVGPKRAVSLLEQYGDALDIYEACPLPGKYKYIQAVNDNKHQILLNYELMDLITYCENAIGLENVQDLEWRLNDYRLQQG
jgi:5'-3' exonuclease